MLHISFWSFARSVAFLSTLQLMVSVPDIGHDTGCLLIAWLNALACQMFKLIVFI